MGEAVVVSSERGSEGKAEQKKLLEIDLDRDLLVEVKKFSHFLCMK